MCSSNNYLFFSRPDSLIINKVFFLSIVFFAHRVYLSPLFPPLEPQTPNRSSLRPLSLIKAKTSSQPPYTYNINYDTFQPDSNLDQANRNGTHQERNSENCYEGDGHVQPIPSKWTKFRRCLRTSLGLRGRDLSILSIQYAQPLILVVLAAIVGICELINGAKVSILLLYYRFLCVGISLKHSVQTQFPFNRTLIYTLI